jgi:uncharacterized protein with FMN-binding domain
MRRAITALIVTVVVVVLLTSFHTHVPALQASALPGTTTRSSGGASSGAPKGTSTTGASSSSSSSASSKPKATPHRAKAPVSHSALGDSIQYRYGIVQVKATVKGGRLTGVQTTTLVPEGGGRSQSIDVQAEPLLRQEALQAHSANIDVISGATYTSQAYAQSLQSAIDRARAA